MRTRGHRVLVLTTYYAPVLGGVETHARVMVRWLRARGLDPLVLATRAGAPGTPSAAVDGVRVYRVPPGGARRQGAKWLAIPFVFSALVRLRARYDVVYCPDPRGVGLAAVAARSLLGTRLVFQAATPGALSCRNWDGSLARLGVDPAGRLGRAIKGIGQRIYGAADAYVCISREIEEEARDAGVPDPRRLHQPHGVDVGEFRPASSERRRSIRDRLGLPRDRVVCLYLGRLSREKGVLDLIEAWRRVDDGSALLAVVGPDMPGHHLDVGPELRARVARHHLEDRVRLLDGTDAPARVMQAADIFVSPSYYEGFGITLAEAMACGLAPVVTPVGGVAEYLAAGHNALLCAPGRPDTLAAALQRLLRDPSLRSALARAARATAEQHFDGDRMAARIAGLLTGNPGRAASDAT